MCPFIIQYPAAPTPERVLQEVDQARDELTAGQELFQKVHLNPAISSAYCACFHAARAVLYYHGAMPVTHKGVFIEFSRRFVTPGWLDPEWGTILAELRNERELADYHAYSRSIEKGDVQQLLTAAERFVNRMGRSLRRGDVCAPGIIGKVRVD